MDLPSALNRGAETPRSRSSVGVHAPGRAGAVGGNNRELLHAVRAVLLLFALQERDPFAVGAPFEARAAAAAGRSA